MKAPVLAVALGLATAAMLACDRLETPTATPDFLTNTSYSCPNGFTLDPAYSSAAGERSADHNEDGAVCWIEVGTASSPHLVYVDNNVPVENTGGCPGGFALIHFFGPQPVDVNGDLLACLGTRPDGSEVYVDNRF